MCPIIQLTLTLPTGSYQRLDQPYKAAFCLRSKASSNPMLLSEIQTYWQ